VQTARDQWIKAKYPGGKDAKGKRESGSARGEEVRGGRESIYVVLATHGISIYVVLATHAAAFWAGAGGSLAGAPAATVRSLGRSEPCPAPPGQRFRFSSRGRPPLHCHTVRVTTRHRQALDGLPSDFYLGLGGLPLVDTSSGAPDIFTATSHDSLPMVRPCLPLVGLPSHPQ
jgi:hypothetical protein